MFKFELHILEFEDKKTAHNEVHLYITSFYVNKKKMAKVYTFEKWRCRITNSFLWFESSKKEKAHFFCVLIIIQITLKIFSKILSNETK